LLELFEKILILRTIKSSLYTSFQWNCRNGYGVCRRSSVKR